MIRVVATVYVETTIVSYLTARPSRDAVLAAHQMLTRDWWRDRTAYELRVSQLVIDEASVGDEFQRARRLRALRGIPVLSLTDSATALRESWFGKGPSRRRRRSMRSTSGSLRHIT